MSPWLLLGIFVSLYALLIVGAVIFYLGERHQAGLMAAAVDEWDGVNDPLDDGTWTDVDSEVVNEAARFRRGGNPE